MTREELDASLTAKGFVLQPDGSYAKAAQRAVADAGDTGQIAVLERTVRHGAMGALQVQKRIGGRFLVRVTSFRRRLLDEDNLCEKYHVDLCRYIGALPGDEAGRTKIEVAQEKVGSKEPERVKIEVFRLEGSVLETPKQRP